MSHAEKCPVCNGSGKISTPNVTNSSAGAFVEKQCHGCDGGGWVTVSDPSDSYFHVTVAGNRLVFENDECVDIERGDT